jgi:hypothetical protein
MLQLIDTRPDIHVQQSEYTRLLGYPNDYRMGERARELADWATRWCAENGKPWIYARQSDGLELADGRLQLNGTWFASRQLHDQLVAARAHGAMLVVVSAGRECEEKARQLWQEGKPDEYFFLEAYASALVEHLITLTGGRICSWAEQNGMAVLPHCSPGYSGWDISDQIKLWELIRPTNGHGLPGELHVMDTGMLRPKKSLLAVFGITRHVDKVRSFANLIPCENCSLATCQYRRVPYQHSLPRIEDVRRLPGERPERANAAFINSSRLNHNAKYSVNPRALRKWSQERLQLRFLEDRSVEAWFRYEGTTCSNMGRPLEFHYHVTLGSSESGYKITETRCIPAPDDTGHRHMCEYLSNAESLINRIADEKPLLGRPLNDVLSWERIHSPSGCYCDADRRAHKWGLVLEVIHYTLVQNEQATRHPGQMAAILE